MIKNVCCSCSKAVLGPYGIYFCFPQTHLPPQTPSPTLKPISIPNPFPPNPINFSDEVISCRQHRSQLVLCTASCAIRCNIFCLFVYFVLLSSSTAFCAARTRPLTSLLASMDHNGVTPMSSQLISEKRDMDRQRHLANRNDTVPAQLVCARFPRTRFPSRRLVYRADAPTSAS